jgi:hypothetical protein
MKRMTAVCVGFFGLCITNAGVSSFDVSCESDQSASANVYVIESDAR